MDKLQENNNDSFDPNNWHDYQPIKELLTENQYLLFSPEPLVTSEDILAHINKSHQEQKIAIFYNLRLGEINISHQHIFVPIMFISCVFLECAKFTDNSYLYPIIFHSVSFEKVSKFKLSVFYTGASFVNCLFKQESSFERVKFLANNIKYLKRDLNSLEVKFFTSFNNVNKVDFLGVRFLRNVSFMSANIGCSILFANYKNNQTIFHKECDFACNVEDIENVLLNDNDVGHSNREIVIKLDTLHRISFVGVKFYKEVTFENRKFEKKTIFNEVIFYQAPKFHNCDLHQDTNFQGSEFIDTYTEGAERAYRTLKMMMNNKSARREEGMFFALEQKSLLNTPLKKYNNKILDYIRFKINDRIVKLVSMNHHGSAIAYKNIMRNNAIRNSMVIEEEHHKGFYLSLTEKIISYLYLLLSDYGQSITKPILILNFFLFFIFPLLYICSLDQDISNIDHWGSALRTSMQQLFKPFEIYSARYSGNIVGNLSSSYYVIATIQSMLNIGLITLFILSIRSRFRVY